MLVLLIDVVGEGAACERKSDDSNEHDEDAADLLSEGRRRPVTITYRRHRRYSEVETGQIKLIVRHVTGGVDPRVWMVVKRRGDDPEASDQVCGEAEDAEKQKYPFALRRNLKVF